MPDISMCWLKCLESSNCLRHQDSGTIPDELQSYMMPNILPHDSVPCGYEYMISKKITKTRKRKKK